MSTIAGLVAGLAVFLLVRGWGMMRETAPGRARAEVLLGLNSGEAENHEQETSTFAPLVERFDRWALALAKRFPQYEDLLLPGDIDQRIIWAGKQQTWTATRAYGWQLLIAITGILLGLYLGWIFAGLGVGTVAGIVLAGAGTWMPVLWLDGEANKRQKATEIALPDMIGMLATTVDAGLNFDQALIHVRDRMPEGPLRQEVNRLLEEIQLGVPRREALAQLALRNRAQSMQLFIGALVQGHELGVPIAETLRVQAELARDERLQRARETAGQATPKITLVTTLLVVPGVLCMVLGIIGYTLMRDMGPLIQSFTVGP